MSGPDHGRVLAALADPLRLEILDRLAAGSEVTVTQLASVLPMTRQGVTRHVRTLEEAGIVVGVREGREHRYRVDRLVVAEAHRWLGRRASSWDAALDRLSAHLEG